MEIASLNNSEREEKSLIRAEISFFFSSFEYS